MDRSQNAVPRDPAATASPGHKARLLPLTSDRALVCDVSYFARRMPLFPVERTFDLSEIAARRAALQPRIAWSVLFLKAFALVAADHPPLRRAYVSWPWPHLVEWPESIGILSVSRIGDGQDRLCWAGFNAPETRRLAELNGHLRWYQTKPVAEAFAKQIEFSNLPLLVRRAVWWWNLNVVGAKRATRLGTFSISSLAGQGAINRGHPTVLTSSLTYGPLDADGRSVVTLLCDHRVLDGVQAAAALNDLEAVLHGEICRELAGQVMRRAA